MKRTIQLAMLLILSLTCLTQVKAATPIKYEPIPRELFAPCDQKGELVKLDYDVKEGQKFAFVYLPYGYDETKKYDVYYVMHGGGDNADFFMGTDKQPSPFKNVIDNCVKNGDIRPMIIVLPSFYPSPENHGDFAGAAQLTRDFNKELIDYLIPAVEGKYSTYAETTDRAGIEASRDHRGFGGFSMGGLTTWYVFIDCLDYVADYTPYSGDCWLYGMKSGVEKGEENAAAIADVVKNSKYGKDGFRIVAATGTKDIAYEPLTGLIEAMKKKTDVFTFTDTLEEGNLHYIVAPDKYHERGACSEYIYDCLRLLYPVEK